MNNSVCSNKEFNIVKLTTVDDWQSKESARHIDKPVWCLVVESCGDNATFCKNEYFGEGQSSCNYELKTVTKNGVTCPDCLKMISKIKSINIDTKILKKGK